jgi:hypothetical protein
MTAQTHTTDDIAAKWADALDRLRAAEATYKEYLDATGPLVDLGNAFLLRQGIMEFAGAPDFDARLQSIMEANPAYFLSKPAEAEMARLARAVDTVELELIAMPAPDAVALEWKFATAARDGFEWDAEHLAQLRTDMDSLLPGVTASIEQVAA